MTRTWPLILTGALLLAPFAWAHNPAGTPKNYCEDPSEWDEHEYFDPPLADVLLTSAPHIGIGGAKQVGPYVDGNSAGDCNGDTIRGDFDGHHESSPTLFALLSVDSGDGVTSGTIVCWHETGHHPTFGPFSVFDNAFDASVYFTVNADIINLVPPTDPTQAACGDFEFDNTELCTTPCWVSFLPGLDGAYHVRVGHPERTSAGLAGHVTSP